MLSSEEHPGVFTFLVGMIVLVMAGVGLSLMVDRHFKFSRGSNTVQHEIRLNAAEITELTARKEEASQLLSAENLKLQPDLPNYQDVSARLEQLGQRKVTLEKSRPQIRESIAALEEEFTRYRATFRRKLWADAIGESLGTLAVRGGRVFQQATITRVTDVGLEIRHEHGIARIQAPDLDPKMQQRFQWSDEERESRLKGELEEQLGRTERNKPQLPENGEVAAEVIDAPLSPQPIRLPDPNTAADAAKLRLLRLNLSGWNVKVSRLRSDKAEASSRASYGRQSSVPGSLETWAARSARLGNDLLRAQVALAAAKSELAAVAPGDPLLRALEPER